MDFGFMTVFFSLACVFTFLALYADNHAFRVIGGSLFLFIGLLLVVQGIDIQSGVDITSVITDNTTVTNEAYTYDTVKDIYTNVFGFIILLIGLYLLLSIAVPTR